MLLFWSILAGFCTGTPVTNHLRKRDAILLLVFGLLFAWLATYWLSLFYIKGSSVIYSDLIEYCTGVTATRPLEAGVSSKRSALPMLLPRFFYDYVGIFDGLAVAALCSCAVMGMLFYLWGALLGGSTLGMIAVFFALVPAPMTFFGRMLTSYPEMSVCFMFGSVTACWGILSQRALPMLLGGIGVSITLLADTRGIIWACPLAAGLFCSALLRGSWKNRILRLTFLILPIVYSHSLAPLVYVFDAIGIEQQVDMRPMLYRWAKLYPPPWDYPSNFTWGMNPLTEFPKTVQFLLEQGTLTVPDELITKEVLRGREIAQSYFWFAGFGAGVALLQWRKQPWKLFALFVSLSPFVIGFRGALTMLEEHTRFYIQTLPGVTILWAVAWHGMINLGAKLSPRAWKPYQPYIRFPAQTALLLCIILGSIPSVASPTADWRREWSGTDARFRDILSRYENKTMHRDPMQRFCRRSLDRNVREGRPLTVTLYDQSFLDWLQTQNRQ